MGGFRALTKHNNSNDKRAQNSRKRTFAQANRNLNPENTQNPPARKSLKVVNLTPHQESSSTVKFVFDALPQSKSDFDTLFKPQKQKQKY